MSENIQQQRVLRSTIDSASQTTATLLALLQARNQTGDEASSTACSLLLQISALLVNAEQIDLSGLLDGVTLLKVAPCVISLARPESLRSLPTESARSNQSDVELNSVLDEAFSVLSELRLMMTKDQSPFWAPFKTAFAKRHLAAALGATALLCLNEELADVAFGRKGLPNRVSISILRASMIAAYLSSALSEMLDAFLASLADSASA